MAKRGRPSTYTEKAAAEICQRLAHGESLRAICKADNMPPESTVREWVVDDRGGFAAHYARAREAQADYMAEEILEIADDGTNDWMERKNAEGDVIGEQLNSEHIQRSRLRVDTRKWLMSKMLPKKYGEKVTVDGQQTIKTEEPELERNESLTRFAKLQNGAATHH